MIGSKDYWRGFHDGAAAERKKCIEVFHLKIKRLLQVKGIGLKTYGKIVDSINKPLKGEEK